MKEYQTHTSQEQPAIQLKPIISYPRIAEAGKIYLLTIDIQLATDSPWPYQEEEFEISFLLETVPFFTHEPLGEHEPGIVLHRFGSTYGPAEYLLTASEQEVATGHIKIALLNGWGLPIAQLKLECEVKQDAPKSVTKQISGDVTGRSRTKSSLNALSMPVEILCSYANADEPYHRQLGIHLSTLNQQGLNLLWYDQQILPGMNMNKATDSHLSTASIILLLISPDFIASDYCYGVEMKQALEQHEVGEARVIPIVVRPCDWRHLPIGKLQALPADALPISQWEDIDEAWKQVTAGLRHVIEDPFASAPWNALVPPIWMVPSPRNPFFVGREAVFHSLRKALVPRGRTTVISGLGGIGKTQVAIEYAHRYAQNYEAVLWLQADSWEALTLACLQLATKVLGLPEQQDAQRQVEAVKHWLQTHRKWLLILDNIEMPQEILPGFLPIKHQGSVLITTRMRNVEPLARSESLPLFSDEEGVLFLLRRARLLTQHASVEDATQTSVLLARVLCKLMDRLPLALDQAGAYIAATRCSFQRYIDLYQQSRSKLLDRRGATNHANMGDHPDSVLMTFWLSWEQIRERNALAGKVLQFCAFLAPDQIPEQLVLEGMTRAESETTRDTLEMEEALGLLQRYSLVERAEHTLSFHRLVQEVVQEVLSEEERNQSMKRAVMVVNAVFPSGEYGTWSLCEFLLPHALTCAKWIEVLRQPEGARLLSAIGLYLYERAQYAETEPLFQRALLISEEQLGASHPQTATNLNNLAELYRAQGRYAEAEPLLQRALYIREEQLGASHPDMAQSLNNLAELYRAQGRYGDAEWLSQRALHIREEQLGASHPQAAASLNNLAELYGAQGRYAEAEPLFQRALHIREEQLGASHPQTAASLNNLAELYRAQGRYAEAEPLLQRALHIRGEQLGASHPDMAQSLNNLAELYRAQGRYGDAERFSQRALHIREEQLGASHPQTAASLNNLAELYRAQGRYAEAEPLLQRALHIREEQLGASHPQTAASLNNLAELYRAQGRYAEAEPLFQQALHIREEQLGASHPQTAASLNNLASLYQAQRNYAQAKQYYQRALEICQKTLGLKHPHTATCLSNLAGLYKDQRQYIQAKQYYQRALSICEQVLGPRHPDTAATLKGFATLYTQWRNYAQAEPHYKRAISICEQILGDEHPDTINVLTSYAGMLRAANRNTKAADIEARIAAAQAKRQQKHSQL